jgi:hypothetical protein
MLLASASYGSTIKIWDTGSSVLGVILLAHTALFLEYLTDLLALRRHQHSSTDSNLGHSILYTDTIFESVTNLAYSYNYWLPDAKEADHPPRHGFLGMVVRVSKGKCF